MIPFLNPWVLLGGLAAAITLILGSYFYGVNAGVNKTEAVWQKREAIISAASAKTLSDAYAKVSALERKIADIQAQASATLQQKLKEKDNAKTIAVAAARTTGLWIGTRSPKDCGDPTSKATPATSGHNDSTAARLSDTAAEFLISEATRADKVVEQLTACQAIVTADRIPQEN